MLPKFFYRLTFKKDKFEFLKLINFNDLYSLLFVLRKGVLILFNFCTLFNVNFGGAKLCDDLR